MKILNTRKPPLLILTEHLINRVSERCPTLFKDCKTVGQFRLKLSRLINYRSDKMYYKLDNGVTVVVVDKKVITLY